MTRPKTFLFLRLLFVPLVTSALSACETSSGPGVQTSVRDSSGVVVVENSGEIGPDGGGWAVTPDPTLSIGTFQGDSLYQLFRVLGATRLKNGGVAIANAGSGEIRIFDAEGRFLAAHGRKGEGPGEFQRPALVGAVGEDTLVVVDNDLRRISLVHAEEGFLESSRISDDLGGGAYPQGMFSDASIVLGGGFYWSSTSGVELTSGYSRRSTNFWSTNLAGELVTEFGEFFGSEFFMDVQDEGGGAVSMRARLIPFGKYSMQTVGPDLFYVASGDSWEIQAFDPAGKLRKVFRLRRAPSPVRSEDLEAMIQSEVDEASDPSAAPGIRTEYEKMPVPDFMPAFAGLHADSRGYLWVERYRPPGEDNPVFDILAPDGALVGWVALPPGSDILEIGENAVVVLHRDELEVEYVRVFGLKRPLEHQVG